MSIFCDIIFFAPPPPPLFIWDAMLFLNLSIYTRFNYKIDFKNLTKSYSGCEKNEMWGKICYTRWRV